MSLKLVPNQLVCLRTSTQVLLAEVKEIALNARGELLCWARPLVISTQTQVEDVRQAPDLLWPAIELEAALDVEVLSMLEVLKIEALFPDPERTARLWQFIRHLNAERAQPPCVPQPGA